MVSYVGRGRQAIPLRSAVAGTVLATTGILGVAVFSGSLTRLTSEPARQGWGWDALVRGVPNDPAANRPSIVAARLEADPAVSAVTLVWTGYQPRVQGHSVDGFAEQFVEGHRGFVIVSGRAPDAPDEVALGAKTLRRARRRDRGNRRRRGQAHASRRHRHLPGYQRQRRARRRRAPHPRRSDGARAATSPTPCRPRTRCR